MATIVKLSVVRHECFPSLIDVFRVTRAAEIGVWWGDHSFNLLRNSKLHELWSIDSWLGRRGVTDKQESTMLLSQFGVRSRLIHETSIAAASIARKSGNTFGFIYIDADHGEDAVKQDVDAWLPLLTRPGILAGHDYCNPKKMGVMSVVDELADRLGMPIYLTREKRPSWFFIFGE